MSLLDTLRKRLFRPREEFEERAGEPKLMPPDTSRMPHSWAEDITSEEVLARHIRQRKNNMRVLTWVTITGAVIALGVAVAIFVYIRPIGIATNENIQITITAPEAIASGEQVLFEVFVKNLNEIALESVDLVFTYPEGARPLFGDPPRGPFRDRVSLGRLEAGGEHTERFEAFVFGEARTARTARASLEYRPSNSSAHFAKDIDRTIAIDRSPIDIVVEAPEDITIGQEVDIEVTYVSTADTSFSDVSLDVIYPDGFEFLEATPAPTRDNNFWRVGTVAPTEERSIRIRGRLIGAPDEVKYIATRIGLFNESTSAWSVYGDASVAMRLRDALLAVEALADGGKDHVARLGDIVRITLNWRNNLPVTVQNMIIEAELEGDVLDFASVSVAGGSYDGARKRLVWNAFSNPALKFAAPGAAGQVAFNVRVHQNPFVQKFSDKNFIGRANATIFSNTIPEGYEGSDITGRDEVAFKVASRMGFASRAWYYDTPIANSGPLPPKVGQETTYTITWSLTNISNDMESVTVRAGIPAYIRWKGRVEPSSERVSYDTATGEIVWDVGALVAGIGYTRPAREVSFQLGLVPGPDLAGSQADLMSGAQASGRDTFTNAILQAEANKVSTAMRNDTKVQTSQYRVTN